jgi:hypothetical protein
VAVVFHRTFVKTDMILFLNKRDLFEEKVRVTAINSIPLVGPGATGDMDL